MLLSNNIKLCTLRRRRERAVPRTKDAPAQPEKLHVLLSEPGSSGDPEATANAALLEAGLAQLQRPPPRQLVRFPAVEARLHVCLTPARTHPGHARHISTVATRVQESAFNVIQAFPSIPLRTPVQ